MRQKDLDQLAEIIETVREYADPVELPGIEAVVGQVIRTVSYGNRGTLDFRNMEALLERIKAEQRDDDEGLKSERAARAARGQVGWV
jgi:hypothetical protein